MGCECDLDIFHYYNAYLTLRKYIFTVTSTALVSQNTFNRYCSPFREEKFGVLLFCNFPLCSACRVPGTSECPPSALPRVNTQTATLSDQTASAGLSLLTTRAHIWCAGGDWNDFSLLYTDTHGRTHRGTVAFQRMLTTNSDVTRLTSPAFRGLPTNRVVQKWWRKTLVLSVAGVAPALCFHKRAQCNLLHPSSSSAPPAGLHTVLRHYLIDLHCHYVTST